MSLTERLYENQSNQGHMPWGQSTWTGHAVECWLGRPTVRRLRRLPTSHLGWSRKFGFCVKLERKIKYAQPNIFPLLFYIHHADEQSWAQHTFLRNRATFSPGSLTFLIGKVLHFHKITRKKVIIRKLFREFVIKVSSWAAPYPHKVTVAALVRGRRERIRR